MTPVISPWVFYLLYAIDSLKCLSVIGAFLSLAAIFFIAEELRGNEKFQIYMKRSCALFIIFITFSLFIPNSNIITKMIVAQNVTYERVEAATDTVQEVYEDFMELFGEEAK